MPPKKNTAPREYAVGDRVTVTLHTGQLVDATIRAIVHSHKGLRYLVDYLKDQTALVESWRLRPSH